MTKQRAEDLRRRCWERMQAGIDETITPEEHQEVLAVWRTMDGSSCYYDALCRMAGEPPMSPDYSKSLDSIE